MISTDDTYCCSKYWEHKMLYYLLSYSFPSAIPFCGSLFHTFFIHNLPSICGEACVLFTLFVFACGVQHILCLFFVLFVFVLRTLCC